MRTAGPGSYAEDRVPLPPGEALRPGEELGGIPVERSPAVAVRRRPAPSEGPGESHCVRTTGRGQVMAHGLGARLPRIIVRAQ